MCIPLSSILQFIKDLPCLSLANKVQHNLASCNPCRQLVFFHLCTTSHPNPDCSSNMPLDLSIYCSLFLEEKSQISAQFSSLPSSSLSSKVNRSKRPSLTTFCKIVPYTPLFSPCVCMCARSLQLCPSLQHPRLLCPWDSPDKNTGVDCHAFLQVIFPTQGWNHVSFVSCSGRGFFTTSVTQKAPSFLYLALFFFIIFNTTCYIMCVFFQQRCYLFY